ncbi:amidohydrolase [Bifidobacterium callimiconis]|uniref:Amidohydrolase n=1 Tax=Bifidobacterium callimiconis TaxID=2306973 RepID=A0A430FH24_9BIFI|nr:amidohydrolase family protein [Bifidobacterium callimiconis]RSX52072.1 amidohydrolase [Bifidobacterium callimiconis]
MTKTLFVASAVHSMTGADDAGANAVLVDGAKIAAVGSVDDLRARDDAKDAKVVDFGGGVIAPGLTDSHSHPISGATADALGVDLTGSVSMQEAQRRLKDYAATVPAGEWVYAWGLDPTLYHGGPLVFEPFAGIIGDRHCVIAFADMHSLLVSPAVLKAAGINGPVEFPNSSASIACYPDGTPTGHVLEFEAKDLIYKVMPPLTEAQKVQRIVDVLNGMASTGLTGAHVMDLSDGDLALLAKAEESTDLGIKLRIHPVARQAMGSDISYLQALLGRHGRRWAVTGVKLFMDGSIDGGTAWLQEPDVHGDSDFSAWTDLDAYRGLMRNLIAARIDTVAHAIGDKGVLTHVQVVSDLLKELGDVNGGGHGSHSIEHLEMMDDDTVRTVASSPLFVSMMPLHCTRFLLADHTDNWSRKLGEPREGYAFRTRTLVDEGATLAIGSDWPVAPYDPRATIADGMLRRPFNRPELGPVVPDEALTVQQLLDGYTRSCAVARGEAATSGKLAPGYTADLTVFGADPYALSAEEIGTMPILGTVIDGDVVYSA